MSAREEERGPQAEPRTAALAMLRERFPEPWGVEVYKTWNAWCSGAGVTGVKSYSTGPDPLSSARACVAAWDEATKGCAPFQRAIGDACRDAYHAERAHADRLAEALMAVKHDRPSAHSDEVWERIGEALAAHAERRKA